MIVIVIIMQPFNTNIVVVNRRSNDAKNKKTRRELTSINKASPVGM